jgi:hypothetical protein
MNRLEAMYIPVFLLTNGFPAGLKRSWCGVFLSESKLCTFSALTSATRRGKLIAIRVAIESFPITVICHGSQTVSNVRFSSPGAGR